MNPPFNIDSKTKQYIREKYGGRPLLPEIWLQKAVELWGRDVPIVMFTPYGFRLNQSDTSARWQKFASNQYPPISTIVSLPKDVFDGILFHSEVLMFNIKGLGGHYFVRNYVHERSTAQK
jgi:type I restriction enzyme M protein